MKHWLFLALIGICAAPAMAEPERPNIIYVIGDGMGMPFLAAYRHYTDDPATEQVESTVFDRTLLGTASTHPHDPRQVTDSAAGATALGAGVKTYNGAIGVDAEGKPVESLLERARRAGYTTAMIATSQINHATPASFAAHIDDRDKYNAIADQYLDRRFEGRPWVDLLLGGGSRYFQRDDRDLVAGFGQLGYEYADSLEAVEGLQSLPALGLLAPVGLPFAVDEHPRRLTRMTQKALTLLEGETPFFMMVEASLIDWCGHANDIACAMEEMADAEGTWQAVLDYAEQHPDTLVVMTADHSTGGLSMGAGGDYAWKPSVVHRVSASAGEMAEQLVQAGDDWPQKWQELTAIELDKADHRAVRPLLKAVRNTEESGARKDALWALADQLKLWVDRASVTGWTTSGHTGEDVPIMAAGPGSEVFAGHMDNTAIAERLFERLPEP